MLFLRRDSVLDHLFLAVDHVVSRGQCLSQDLVDLGTVDSLIQNVAHIKSSGVKLGLPNCINESRYYRSHQVSREHCFQLFSILYSGSDDSFCLVCVTICLIDDAELTHDHLSDHHTGIHEFPLDDVFSAGIISWHRYLTDSELGHVHLVEEVQCECDEFLRILCSRDTAIFSCFSLDQSSCNEF